MSKKNVTYFQDEWLDDDRFSKWVMKTHLKTHARYSICQRDFDLSTVGVSALLSHATEKKKHKTNWLVYLKILEQQVQWQ